MSRLRMLAALSGGVGALAAGAVAGTFAERKTVRAVRLRPDAVATEPFGQLPADRTSVVTASDGVLLHVEEIGPLDADVTMVFCHGWTLELAMWHFQRQGLADVGRLVFFDHRSHGRSGSSPAGNCTIDQLGRDLEAVIEQRVPAGRVVLIGHSMGGMTIMALAERRPELFERGGKVVAVSLVCTSAGAVSEAVFGLPAGVSKIVMRTMPRALVGLGKRSTFLDERRSRGFGNDLSHAFTRRLCFGPADVPASVVDLMERMIAATPLEVIAAFLPAVLDHDKLAALPTLKDIPVLIVAGAKDLITPVAMSRAMSRALPSAELVVLPDAGHMAVLERPALVNLHLRALVARARKALATAA
jgi:pimeloyl-ACP methyl ester carboxylesterase